MATPDFGVQNMDQQLADLQVRLQAINSITGAFSSGLQGNFRDAAESVVELHNPIYKLNAALIDTSANMKKLGVDMEQAMVNASMRAAILVQRMEMLKARTMALPRAFMARINEGARVESERIAASAGIMRSEYAKSIPEANRILSEVRKVVVKESAPLPGDTFTHLEVLSQTIDDSMKMAKDAGKSVQDAQKFAAEVAGKIGAIGGTAGASNDDIIRFANALMSGTLTARSRLNLVERNPAVKTAMNQVMREKGVKRMGELSRPQRMGAIAEILEKSMPTDQLDAASKTLDGTLEGFKTASKSLFDFSRVLEGAYEGYEGPDVTVFNELKEVVIDLINPMKSLIDAIIANPLTDPMTHLARGIGLLNGFFGNTTKEAQDFEGMDINRAFEELGFIDFAQYIGANANKIIADQLKGNRSLYGMDTSGTVFGTDLMSRLMNSLSSKFRMGIDGVFVNLSQWIKNGEFINNLDIGGSIGTVMAELANAVIYMFNQLLPIVIQQTINLFAAFKSQINVIDLLQFLRLFGGFKNIWIQLQERVSKIAEEAPKLFNKLTEGGTKAASVFGTVGFLVTAFGGGLVWATLQLKKFALSAASVAAAHMGHTGTATNLNNTINEIRDQLRDGTPGTRDHAFGLGDLVRDVNTRSGQIQGSIGWMNPMNLLFNLGSARGNGGGNALQRGGGRLAGLGQPLMMASMMGILPPQLAMMLSIGGLGMSAAGNVGSLFGMRGRAPLTPEQIAAQTAARRGATNVFGQNLRRGNVAGIRAGMRGMVATNAFGLGTISKLLGPLKGILGKFAPVLAKAAPLLIALGSNIWIVMGAIQMIIGLFKRMYAASPELRRAVARFLTGMKNLFDKIGRFVIPLYKRYIQPIFKILGDILAKWLNMVMDFWNIFGIFGSSADYGDSASRSVTMDEASGIAESRREKRTDETNEAIERGRDSAIYARFMGTPQIINAAGGFGQIDVPSLMHAATMEAKMMPANESLVLANTSETILTPDQMAATVAMSRSRANITVPKIDIMITAHNNQNPQQIANEVANVLMMKLEDTQNMA